MIDQWVEQIRAEGFVVIPNIIPAAECDDVSARLQVVAKRWRRTEAFNKLDVSHVPGLINFDQTVARYIADDQVLAVAEKLLGKNLRVSFTTLQTNEAGKERSEWHADWPYNQWNACHLPAPYPDLVMHLTSLLMISPFTEQNGGTLVVPGSHREPNNPTDPTLGIDLHGAHPNEFRVTGSAGSMAIFDSRTWHAAPANPSNKPRISVGVRYAPWWLNLEPLDPNSELRRQWVDEPGLHENDQQRLRQETYESLPEKAKPLYRHWLERNEGPDYSRV
jgi:hypothetical protein